MKKVIIALVFALGLFVAKEAQAQLNINVGYSPELITTKTPTHDTTLFYHGVQIGINWTFDLSDKLSLTAGAQYRMNLRDASQHYWQGAIFIHDLYRERQTLVDVPILLKYKLSYNDNFSISPFVGPMLSWGIQGRTTESITYPSNAEMHQEWYGDTGHMKRFNVYATAGVEASFRRFTISLGGRYGFLDLNKRNTGVTIHAYGFFASFGHSF